MSAPRPSSSQARSAATPSQRPAGQTPAQSPGSNPEPSAQSPGRSSSNLPHIASSGDSLTGSGSGLDIQRARFDTFELASVLSHYELGIIHSIKEYPRGSRKSPKLLIRTEDDTFLLKRRAPGRDDPYKVAFCHSLQMYLAQRKFPLPHLIGTRADNNSMLRFDGKIYELFEYIKGVSYDGSLKATSDAGKALALFHKLLRDFQSPYTPPNGSYHAARSVDTALQQIPGTLQRIDPQGLVATGDRLAQLVQFLDESYHNAAARAEQAGLPDWPQQIVHCDWHPGNMLFRGSRIVGVIDYDAARLYQRIVDIANGALQFSIIGGGENPAKWPDYLDESRYKRFLRGYESVPDCLISRAELRIIPDLMIEALIAESVIPIAATGSFARMDGTSFLLMVQRKVRWLEKQAQHLIQAIEG